jgi:hypothetical protein
MTLTSPPPGLGQANPFGDVQVLADEVTVPGVLGAA